MNEHALRGTKPNRVRTARKGRSPKQYGPPRKAEAVKSERVKLVKTKLHRSVGAPAGRLGEHEPNGSAACHEAVHHGPPPAAFKLRARVKRIGGASDHNMAANGVGSSERAKVRGGQNTTIGRDGRGSGVRRMGRGEQ